MIFRRRGWSLTTAALALLIHCSFASAAGETRGGWGNWWLPPQHTTHGGAMDSLFNWIFGITMVTFVGVEGVLVMFLIKYRHRPGRKALFTHGNTRLEMAWTIAPAIILALLALFSKKVWDNYRYSPTSQDPSRAQVLVIGEQFKWNIIYPGPDGKLGRYLLFPKPTDERWQNPDGSDKPYEFAGVTGPALLPAEKAQDAIKAYMAQVNTLGKDFSDPDGRDDNTEGALGRTLVLPKNRPIEVQLSSKDVIHNFFLPNFRVKLDAVPGMRGRIYFTATMASKEREKREAIPVDRLIEMVKDPRVNDLTLVIGEDTPGSEMYKPRRGPGYRRYADKDKATIAREGSIVTPEVAQKLKEAGVKQVVAYRPGTWELVCEELCGQGHTTMRGILEIVDSDEYDKMKLDKPYRAPLTDAPSAAPAQPLAAGN